MGCCDGEYDLADVRFRRNSGGTIAQLRKETVMPTLDQDSPGNGGRGSFACITAYD